MVVGSRGPDRISPQPLLPGKKRKKIKNKKIKTNKLLIIAGTDALLPQAYLGFFHLPVESLLWTERLCGGSGAGGPCWETLVDT